VGEVLEGVATREEGRDLGVLLEADEQVVGRVGAIDGLGQESADTHGERVLVRIDEGHAQEAGGGVGHELHRHALAAVGEAEAVVYHLLGEADDFLDDAGHLVGLELLLHPQTDGELRVDALAEDDDGRVELSIFTAATNADDLVALAEYLLDHGLADDERAGLLGL